jgi:hypothetical protein
MSLSTSHTNLIKKDRKKRKEEKEKERKEKGT